MRELEERNLYAKVRMTRYVMKVVRGNSDVGQAHFYRGTSLPGIWPSGILGMLKVADG